MAPEVAETEVLPGVGAAISRETVQLYLRAFGRGPTKSRTYVQADYAVCVLRDVFTAAERTLVSIGGREQVEASRRKVTDAMDGEFVALVERETGRQVRSHLTHVKVPANLAVHFFLFDAQAGNPRHD
ncbi:MAG TPA: Na-translocating system protein MpsC family protein [Solirubrobacterales bacterium]|nr:Na-translocating system protein MpsC family protein [Solirubrobacterales bacterium]